MNRIRAWLHKYGWVSIVWVLTTIALLGTLYLFYLVETIIS
jgi:uncharacterized iron-regulated membrane protein